MSRRLVCLASLALVAISSGSASAQAPLLGGLGGPLDYGSSCLHRNDDQSSDVIDLTPAFPAGLRFFDRTHTTAYVNTNGNITFSGPVSTYTPRSFPVADQPMIAPYWADIDTRGTPSGGCTTESRGTCSGGDNSVWWHLEPGQMIVTWYNTGYFSCHLDKRMSLQLILRAVPGCGGSMGDFDVEFRYNRCEWETGDASGGSGGFGGTEAQAGFDAGNTRDYVAIPGSLMPGIANLLCTTSNVGEPGVWRFQIRSGTVICPDAGEPCDTGMTGVCAEGVTQCVAAGTECTPVVPASDERCDGLDNDCDGSVDEGTDLCTGSEICDRGSCIDVCFEGGCPEGQLCTEAGRCVDVGCEDLECPVGQRCSMGECVGACDGVVCPVGLSCRAGRCLDLCADLSCDPECTVCSEGECVVRCDLPGGECGPGETCTAEGRCEPTACIGVTCEPGFVCQPGRGCVDACAGAVCPNGEVCELGSCVPNMSTPGPDGGMMDADGGAMDSGVAMDSGAPDAGVDAGRVIPRSDDGCGCATPGTGGRPQPLWALALGLTVLWRRRRRRG